LLIIPIIKAKVRLLRTLCLTEIILRILMMVMEMTNLVTHYLSAVTWFCLGTVEPVPFWIGVLTAIEITHKVVFTVLEAIFRILWIAFLHGHDIFAVGSILRAGGVTDKGKFIAEGFTAIGEAASCPTHDIVVFFIFVANMFGIRAHIETVPWLELVTNFDSISFVTVFSCLVTDFRAFNLGVRAFLATETFIIADLKTEDWVAG
jgi:hypothetical protein